MSGCGQGAHVPLYVPLLVLAFLDLCALLRVWSTFGKRYGAAFRDFQRLLCARLSLCFKHAPLLVLVFLGFCRLLFGKSPLCKQKKQCSRRTTKHNFGCAFFFVRLCVCCSRTSCTFRALSSPSSTCAPCSAFGQRLARDNNSATHARLSRFSTLALRPIISLFQTRSAPRSRLSRLLPFALWQDTSLQAKKQCSRRTTKHNFGCAFSSSDCGRGAHVLRVRSAPRSRLSRLLPFALWQVTSLQAKKQCSRRTTKARRFAVLFDIKSVDKRCVFRLLFYIRDRV